MLNQWYLERKDFDGGDGDADVEPTLVLWRRCSKGKCNCANAAFREKEKNYWYPLRVTENRLQSCPLSRRIHCVDDRFVSHLIVHLAVVAVVVDDVVAPFLVTALVMSRFSQNVEKQKQCNSQRKMFRTPKTKEDISRNRIYIKYPKGNTPRLSSAEKNDVQ